MKDFRHSTATNANSEGFEHICNLARDVLRGRTEPRTTRELCAAIVDCDKSILEQAIYDVLRRAATRDLAAFARKGEPREIERFGRKIMQRPWLWADYGMPGPDAIRHCPTCGQLWK